MSIEDEIFELECDNCDTHGYTVRVTGGDLAGAHLSTYACSVCASFKEKMIERKFPDATEIVALPQR